MLEMRSHLQDEIEKLRIQILNMVALTERALEKATKAYVDRDEFLAEEVIDGDEKINELEVEIDRQGLKILALETPVAIDLRFVLGCMRISVDLERIADEAVNIAERAMILSSRPALPFSADIQLIAEKAMKMLQEAIRAFSASDAEQAWQVIKQDSGVDALNHRIVRKVIEYMINDTPAVERSVHTVIIVRRFERVADLATNIAEHIIFIEQGRNVKHYHYFDKRAKDNNE